MEGGGCPAPRSLSTPAATAKAALARRGRGGRGNPRAAPAKDCGERQGPATWKRLGDDRSGGSGVPLDRLLPRRPTRDHRPRQLLDVDGCRASTRRSRRRTTPSSSTTATYWDNMALDGHDVGDRGRGMSHPRLPGRVLPRSQDPESAHPDRALHHCPGAVLDELPHPRDRVDLPAHGPRGSPEPGTHQAPASSPSPSRSSASRRSRCAWR